MDISGKEPLIIDVRPGNSVSEDIDVGGGKSKAMTGVVSGGKVIARHEAKDPTLPPLGLCLTHEELWEKLVNADEDCVEYYLYPYSRLVKLACFWPWIILGIACALYAGATEIVTASAKSAYTVGYISGASAFALVAGILLVPVCVKGGIWNKLITKKVDKTSCNPSYYEVIDVILRDISGMAEKAVPTDQPPHGKPGYVRRRSSVHNPGFGDPGLVSIPFSDITASTRRKYREDIQCRMYGAYAFILLTTAALTTFGAFTIKAGVESYTSNPPDDIFTYRARINGVSVPNAIMYIVAAFNMSVAVSTLWLASCLHRTQTEMFCKWVKRFRLVDSKGQNVDELFKRLKDASEENKNCSFNPFEYRYVMEAYLFMQSLFDKSSEAWGMGLSVWIIATGGLFFLSLLSYALGKDPSLQVICLGLAAVNFVVCIVPIFMLAYANGFVDHISGAFQQAGFQFHDYARIGGREHWREYIASNPAYWYIFGFAITRSWLMGFTTGAVSAFVLIGLDKLMDLEAK